MGQLSAEVWALLRKQYETDPSMTHSDIATSAGVARQTVYKRAKREDWKKVVAAKEVTRQAHRVADRSPEPEPVDPVPAADIGPVPVSDPAYSEGVGKALVDDAVAKRAKVLERHRTEWNAVRSIIYAGLTGNNAAKAKLGKTSAEALKIVQEKERQAWGLDDDDPPAPKTQFIRG